MKEELIKIAKEVPYNSFGPFLVSDAIPYNSRLGGNCVLQNRMLTELLFQSGYKDVSYISTTEGITHYATLCSEGNSLYYLDPFILQKEPLSLSKLFSKGRVAIEAYPNENKLIFQTTGENMFSVTVETTKDNQRENIRTYVYDLQQSFPRLPELGDESLLHRQKSLVLRVLTSEIEFQQISLDHNTGLMSFKSTHPDGKRWRQRYDTVPFTQQMTSISEVIGVTTYELEHAFYNAHNSYLQRFSNRTV